MRSTEHAVVIAGGGPTGLMLAGELALAGIDVVIVERRASQELDGSRAGGLHARTIEVLDQRGIAERFLSAGQAHPAVGFAGIPLGHQRLPHAPQLRARALAARLRAHPGRLGRRARGADPSRPRGGGLRAGRHRRRRRAVRRHVAPSGVPRRVRRRTQRGPQGRRHRLRRVGPVDQLDDRRGRDGRGAGDRHAPRGRWHRSRQPSRGRRAVRGRAARRSTSNTPASPPCEDLREALVAAVRDRLRGAQPDLDLPLHRHDAAGGVVPRRTRAARRRRRPRASARKADRASTPACRTP